MPKRIIALGGGGFLMDGERSSLDDHVLRATGKPRPRVCFVPTAAADSDALVVRFYEQFMPVADCSVVRLFRREVADLDAFLSAHDAVYVGPGNSGNMLAVWRHQRFDVALRRAWEAGVVMAGMSAGAICWFEGGVTDTFGAVARTPDGMLLGWLRGSFVPHYDSEETRRPLYHRLVREGELAAGYGVDDGVALCFEGEGLAEAVSSRTGAKLYRVERGTDGEVVETELPVRLLA
jgi:peptidase E